MSARRRNSRARRPSNFGKQRGVCDVPSVVRAIPGKEMTKEFALVRDADHLADIGDQSPLRALDTADFVSQDRKLKREKQKIEVFDVVVTTIDNEVAQQNSNQSLTPQQRQRQKTQVPDDFVDALPTPSDNSNGIVSSETDTPSENDIKLMEQQVEAMKIQLEEAHRLHRLQMQKHSGDMQDLKSICEELVIVIERGRSRCSFFLCIIYL